MRISNKVRNILISILAGLLLVLALWPLHHTMAQEGECSAPYFIDATLATGSRWTMCWEERVNEGIVLHDITFTPPGQPQRLVLAEANLAQLHVAYDDNGARFHDLSDYGLGGGNLDDLTAAECPGGTLLSNNGRNVLCLLTKPRGYAYKYYDQQLQGEALTLFSASGVGAYNYIVQWAFYDSGAIEPMVGASGQLQRYAVADPAHGWPLDAGNVVYGVAHTHNYYWRLDFDLVDSNNDLVEEIAFTPNGDRSEFTLGLTSLTTEAARPVSPANFRSWRVKDKVVTNGDGHAISYQLEPEPHHIFHGPAYDPWTQNEFYVTHFNPCERWASHNPTSGGCGNNLSNFVNGENVDGTDGVVWYGHSFHHLPQDEDETYMHTHWSSFVMRPRDWTATNPLDQASVSTPTPIPTPPVAGAFCSLTPVAIPDNGAVSTQLAVPEASSISDLDVSLTVEHSWVGDLVFTLSHNGRRVTLIDRPGFPANGFGCDGDDIHATLDDEAGSPVEDQCAPGVPTIGGSFVSNESLADFDGQYLVGNWTLTISDTALFDAGVLNQFCLIAQRSSSPTYLPFILKGR
jgi:primary-amine oxidase